MKKQYLITLTFIIVILLIAFFVNKNSISNSTDIKKDEITKIDNSFTLCGKDYANYELKGFTVTNKIKISNNYGLYYLKLGQGITQVARLDGCTGKIATLVTESLDKDGIGNSYFLNNSVYIFKNKYVIRLTDGFDKEYNSLYVQDLSKDDINIEEPWKTKYRIIDLELSNSETILNYEYSCGEGCDSETRRFSATTTENSISIDIFDKNKKYDLTLPNGIKVKANTKIRTITLGVDKFEK